MDFANRGNRPSQTPQQNEALTNEQPKMAFQAPVVTKAGGSKLSKVTQIIMVVVVAILVLSLILALVFRGDTKTSSESALIKQDKFQAVFLNSQDGQVYFGKLEVYNNDLYYLTDIYYVRVENPIQPEGANQAQQPNISLAKLGNELHGPEDSMYISRDKVLYWENLKDDGQVVTAIKSFKENGEQAPADTTNTQQQTPAPAGSTQQTNLPGSNGSDTPNDTPTAP